MKYTHNVVIGDWSNDGHGKSDIVPFVCTHDQEAIRKAYHDFVNKYKIGLHGESYAAVGDDYVGILCEYEDCKISKEVYDILARSGIKMDSFIDDGDVDEYLFDGGPTEVAELFMEMVKTQIPGFNYNIPEEGIETINGFWQDGFNYSFGYGVYN